MRAHQARADDERGYRSEAFPTSWSVEGVISCDTFADFDLSLEWRLAAGGNSGALYGLYPPAVEARCPRGVFNDARIRVRGTRVEHWLNSACVVRFDMASKDFRARVARSKFALCPLFAQAGQGHLVLQHHGEEAWFRNLRLE